MAKGKKQAWKRALRVDTLMLTLVLVCIGLLAGTFGTGDGLSVFSAFSEKRNVDSSETDFGEIDSAGVKYGDELSDSQLNGKLADMPDAAKCKPFRFLMLNANNYFVSEDTQRARFKISVKKEESRNAVAEVIASARPEVVGLIEMGGPYALSDLQGRLREKGLDYPYTKILLRSGEDRALAVLSQHPIVQDKSRPNCSLLGNKRQKMLRGILDITVQVGQNRFYRVVGAHLKSRVSDAPAAATARRKTEARTLAMYLQKEMRKTPHLPVVVYGDWNDGPAEDSLKVLTQGISEDSALSPVQAADSRGQTWTIYYRAAQEYSLFDRIFVNKVLRSRRGRSCEAGIVDIPASESAGDHRAVWCELR